MATQLTEVIGAMPYRMALAGGWIDQPFVSRLNPDPTGSIVTVTPGGIVVSLVSTIGLWAMAGDAAARSG